MTTVPRTTVARKVAEPTTTVPTVSAIPAPATDSTQNRTGAAIESTSQGAPTDAGVVAEAADPTVVDIEAYEPGGVASFGSGLVLSSQGEIVTNFHVINGALQLKATDVGNGQTYVATVVGTDEANDLAVLQLGGASGLQVANTGDSSSLYLGEGVVAVGNANGSGGTPSYAGGMLTSLSHHIVEQDDSNGWSTTLDGVLETNADILPGDSGGPLLDSNGDVVGLDTAILDSSTGGFAIPINQVLQVVDEIESMAAS
jgi:S1-C subfamily serine protease